MEKRIIPGYFPYAATSDGHIYNCNTCCYLQESVHSDRAVRVTLNYHGKRYQANVRDLVARAFIPNPENKPWVEHIDGNPNNNCVENLKWVSKEEKSADQPYHEPAIAAMKKARSKAIAMCKMYSHDEIQTFASSSDAAKALGDVKMNSLISRCANGKVSNAYGFYWKWIETA